MLQQESPDDFVDTGNQCSVRDFIEFSCDHAGIEIIFDGCGLNEIGIVKSFEEEKNPGLEKGQKIIKVDQRYFILSEVDNLLGDPSKAIKKLGWKPKVSLEELCKEMMDEDLKFSKRDNYLRGI